MPNTSQLHSRQQWEKWRRSGALGTIAVQSGVPGNPIHSVEEFLRIFGVGDTFWEIGSWCGAPVDIEEQRILAVDHDPIYGAILTCERYVRNGKPMFVSGHHVADAVNKLHGACRTQADAERYLTYRQEHHVVVPMSDDDWDDDMWSELMD